MSLEENKRLGYVSLFRSMLDWEWFKDSSTLHIFVYCLLKANHKDKRYKGDVVKRGSFLTSRKLIAEETGLTEQKVRTALNHLKITNELTISTSPKGTVISINNYDRYQKITNDLTNKQPTTNQQVTTNNNDNNDNNVNNVVVSADTTTTTTPFRYDVDFERFWKAYKKKGNKRETYDVWNEKNFSNDEIELVVFAAKEYSKEHENDRNTMMYSRTFLENENYLDYEEKMNPHSNYIGEEDDIDEKVRKFMEGY